ncbi:alanine racemase [uncultured Limosilactobacillus sp.]|uniref:alanine racemase n=1 Tax=uncultured Limosilactobacillus sp. TaxID=2837629 RepID=UPI0025D602C7|nr:alanine racemase [uncultured Limosilactobacillus sp.]
MTVGRMRDAQLTINLAAIQDNIASQKAALAAGSHVFAVVKANAYGCGLIPVAQAAVQAGVDGFCVAILDEGLALREAGINQTTLVLGITPVKYAALAANQGISLAVGSVEWLDAYRRMARQQHIAKPLKVHLALDTGMGRIGFTTREEFRQALAMVQGPEFDFEGIFTHFATADGSDEKYFRRQFRRWQQFMTVVKHRPRYCHVANSSVGLWHHDVIIGNTVRMGISMYGESPAGRAIAPTIQLKPVMEMSANLTYVKLLQAGDSVGYGKTYTAQQNEWIGTLPVGYADGYPRRMQGFHVLIAGQECEIVGRVCMDQLMVRLPKKVPVGTRAIFIGHSGNQRITLNDIADYAGTINYEIMTMMGERLKRVYHH